MVPPLEGLNLDVEAISGILGSISIACWVTVFSPQILENFRRGSAESLSVQFIIVWSLGDLFNVIGGILQGVLPTMIILAVYYLLADIVLLGQCFYYRGFTWRDDIPAPANTTNERTALLDHDEPERGRRLEVDAVHFNPTAPLVLPNKPRDPSLPPPRRRTTLLQAAAFNAFAILMVILAGLLGWYVSNRRQGGSQLHSEHPEHHESEGDELAISVWGQVFGYGCALLYLGSRLPQILLNWRRKSTEGLSGLFFLFACLGNITYFLSIFAYQPRCHGPDGICEGEEAGRLYRRYLLLNASWLLGSIGCLFLDFTILLQFFMYRPLDEFSDLEEEIEDEGLDAALEAERERDRRPLLQRMDSSTA